MRRFSFRRLSVSAHFDPLPDWHAPACHVSRSPPPKGELRKFSFDQSKIFPGTARDYWIYLPKQYDPAKPACLYVNQDGVQYHAPEFSTG